MITTDNGIMTFNTLYPDAYAGIGIFLKIAPQKFQVKPFTPEHVLKYLKDFEFTLGESNKVAKEVEQMHKEISKCRNTIAQIEELKPSTVWTFPAQYWWLKNDKSEVLSIEDSWLDIDLSGGYDVCKGTTLKSRLKKNHLLHFVACIATARRLEKLAICRFVRRWSPPQRRAILLFEFEVFDVIKNGGKIEKYLEVHQAIQKLEMNLGHRTQYLSSLRSSIGRDKEFWRSIIQ